MSKKEFNRIQEIEKMKWVKKEERKWFKLVEIFFSKPQMVKLIVWNLNSW